ncbi:MAG: PadR family transcriptional regulator [Vicinamibacterales bacterium]
MADQPRSDRFLPLAPVWFEILLALAAGDQHGYAIMQEVARRSDGAVALHPGSLYRALARLLEDALIVELEARPAAGDDERRRYYRLTPLGRAVARAEAERLRALLRAAEARALFDPGPAPKRSRA